MQATFFPLRRVAPLLLLAAPAAWAGPVPAALGPLACEPFQTVDAAREDGAPEAAARSPAPRAHFALVPDDARLETIARPGLLGLKLSATALRTPAERVSLSAVLQRRHEGARKTATGLVGAAHFEQKLGPTAGVLRGSASATLAHLRLQGDGADADALTARAAGPYGKVTFDLAQWQPVEGPLSVYARLAGQWSSKNLDPTEKLALAGPAGVRAFAPGSVAGDRGWLAQWEARLRVAASATAYVFADRGRAELNAEPWDGGSAAARSLSAGGIGLRHAVRAWTLETAVAKPPSATPRFSAQLGLRFD